MLWFLPLLALVSPLFLWPVELLLPFPYILEEIVKALLIYPIAHSDLKYTDKVKVTIILAVLFSLTESVMYLTNIFQAGTISTFILRLFVTTTLHVATSLIILVPSIRTKYGIILGLLGAIVIHYLFNEVITQLLKSSYL